MNELKVRPDKWFRHTSAGRLCLIKSIKNTLHVKWEQFKDPGRIKYPCNSYFVYLKIHIRRNVNGAFKSNKCFCGADGSTTDS